MVVECKYAILVQIEPNDWIYVVDWDGYPKLYDTLEEAEEGQKIWDKENSKVVIYEY